jgi:hypothetical protein
MCAHDNKEPTNRGLEHDDTHRLSTLRSCFGPAFVAHENVFMLSSSLWSRRLTEKRSIIMLDRIIKRTAHHLRHLTECWAASDISKHATAGRGSNPPLVDQPGRAHPRIRPTGCQKIPRFKYLLDYRIQKKLGVASSVDYQIDWISFPTLSDFLHVSCSCLFVGNLCLLSGIWAQFLGLPLFGRDCRGG